MTSGIPEPTLCASALIEYGFLISSGAWLTRASLKVRRLPLSEMATWPSSAEGVCSSERLAAVAKAIRETVFNVRALLRTSAMVETADPIKN